jgi:hypothetical protein
MGERFRRGRSQVALAASISYAQLPPATIVVGAFNSDGPLFFVDRRHHSSPRQQRSDFGDQARPTPT